mgnify:CR=1 FL=1
MPASSDLINELRIDRSAAAPGPARGRRPWLRWLVAAAVLLCVAVVFGLLREDPVPVRVAMAEAQTAAAASAGSSVLDAGGYVTARRIATLRATPEARRQVAGRPPRRAAARSGSDGAGRPSGHSQPRSGALTRATISITAMPCSTPNEM